MVVSDTLVSSSRLVPLAHVSHGNEQVVRRPRSDMGGDVKPEIYREGLAKFPTDGGDGTSLR